MTQSKRILVLGASGYIGRHLIVQLAAAGHQVIAAARHIDALKKQAIPGVEYHAVDLHDPEFPRRLLEQVDTLYYLIHSMGDGANFVALEQQAATHLRNALKQQPVKQIIFLSSLQVAENQHSPHLQARQLTAEILRDSGIPVTELRAGIVIGSGSAAFEVMRDMVYNLPVLTPPRWVRSRTTPIALDNLLYYLVHLLDIPASSHRILEAAGPEVLSYQQQFERFMEISGKHRPLIPIPLPVRWISVWFLNLITSVPPTLASALIQGLKHDLLADDRQLRQLISQPLISFDDAVRSALEDQHKLSDALNWGNDPQALNRWQPDYGFFARQAGCTVTTSASLEELWKVVNQLGGKQGYFFGNALWKTRALMDRLMGHKLATGRPERNLLEIGDYVDSWKVIVADSRQELTLLFGMKAPGLGRLTFRLSDLGHQRQLDVRAWWHPAGMPGLLYWLVMSPAHLFIFRGMAHKIVRLAENNSASDNK